MYFCKRNNCFLKIGVLIIIASIVMMSCTKKSNGIEIKNYFPIDKPRVYELEGTLIDSHNNQIKNIIEQNEFIGKSNIDGKEVYTLKRTYFDNSRSKIMDFEIYLNYDKYGNIREVGRKINDTITWNDPPGTYLPNGELGSIYRAEDKTVVGQSQGSNNECVMEVKGFEDLSIDEKIYKDCIYIIKTFYEGKDITRKEELYLQKDIGVVKYIERSSKDSYILELNYIIN